MPAQIRPISGTSDDDKLARFMIGKATMEGLTIANKRSYFHPITISAWIAVSCIFIEYMNWWPNFDHGPILSLLSPIPALASMIVPILALFDWINRPYFEDATQKTLKTTEFPNISHYYSRSPASSFLICENNDKFIGLIALDAFMDAVTKEKPTKKPTSALIRHFFVAEEYRSTDVQDDLLALAIKTAFKAEPTLKTIRAKVSDLAPYIRKSLQAARFEMEGAEEKTRIGMLDWKMGSMSLERGNWKE